MLNQFKNGCRKIGAFFELLSNQGLKVGLETALGYIMLGRKIKIRYPCGNLEVVTNSRDLPFWNMLQNKKWEYEVIQFLCNLSIKGQIIFDIGAWEGPYTLLLSHLVGSRGQVEAFEPMPNTYKSLIRNVRLNNLNNVNCHNIVVSDVDGNVKIKADSGKSPCASIVRYRNNNDKLTYNSESITIDNFCKKNNIIPDGIKIDVEGAEGLVFKGAIRTIKIYKPWFIIEFHGSFMSNTEKTNNWKLITKYAKEIIYLKGTDVRYSSGDVINKKNIPSGRFIMYIRY